MRKRSERNNPLIVPTPGLRPFAQRDRITVLELPRNKSVNSVDDASVPDGFLFGLRNCTVRRGVFEADHRIKFWKDKPASQTLTARSFVIADIPNSTPCRRLISVMQEGGVMAYNIAQIDAASINGTMNATWQNAGFATSTESSSVFARGWQHLNKVYVAGGASGTLSIISAPCLSSTVTSTPAYQERPWPSNQTSVRVIGDALSEYTAFAFVRTGNVNATDWDGFGAPGTSPRFSGFPSSVSLNNTTSWAFGTLTASSTYIHNTENMASVGPGTGTLTTVSRIMVGLENSGTNRHLTDLAYTLPAAQDWMQHDYMSLRLDAVNLNTFVPSHAGLSNNPFDTISPTGDGLEFSPTSFSTSEIDVLLSTSTAGSDWAKCTVRAQRGPGAAPKFVTVWVDMTSIPASVRSAVRRLRIVFNLLAASQGALLISSTLGGKTIKGQVYPGDELSSPSTPLEQATYVVRYRTADSSVISDGLLAQASAASIQGSRPVEELPRMGSWVEVTAELVGNPFSSPVVEIWRQVSIRAMGIRRWYKVAQNSGAPFTFTDKLSDADLIEGSYEYADTFTLTGVRQYDSGSLVQNVSSGTSWKGSNVLGLNDGKVTFSRVGTGESWIWPGLEPAIDPDDQLAPRRLQVTDDGTAITAMVSQDALYLFSANSCWAMSGEFAATSDWPRRLPVGKGALNSRHVCSYGSGCVVIAEDGLWYQEVPFGFDGSSDKVKLEELTKSNRLDWAWVNASGIASACVAASVRDVWVFNQRRYLHIDEEGNFITGEFTMGPTIVDVAHHPIFGFIVQLSDGKIGHIGAYLSDGGTNTSGSNGATFDWIAIGRKNNIDCHAISARVRSSGTPSNVRLFVTTERGGSDILTWAGSGARETLPCDRVGPASGRWISLELRGAPSDVVEFATVKIAMADSRQNV